ncbi:MAG: class I SAM-dependent methyltransferase [Acidobacteria bacterium]|nr:class I SAM-dependent methyltransferase [Acidobacteriota bacterium]
MASEVKPGGLPALPREMERHTYAIMYEVEGTHWWFAGRRRILESFVRGIVADLDLGGRRRPRILDVGCGTGANLEMLAQFGATEGVDVSEDALAFCRARGLHQVKLGAAEQLPYEDGSFDLVTALDVVEHLDDDSGGLSEMRRVLRPGGRALLFVPAFMWLWGVQDDVSHHRRRYTLPQLTERVRGAGFAVERATYANLTFFAPILAGRLLMRATGARPASENNINVSALNGLLGRLFGAERFWLGRGLNFPFGVSAVCVARKLHD